MRNSEWLREQSPVWVREGIISEEQQEMLHNRYPLKKQTATAMLAIIGSLLIGAGIILIFATNWWRLPVAAKLVLAFLPLFAAMLFRIYIEKKGLFTAPAMEGGGIFLCLSFYAAVALIGQAFHLASDLYSYILTCTICVLPAIYLYRSSAVATLFSAGLAFLSWDSKEWPVILFLLALPFFFYQFRMSPERGRKQYLLLLLSFNITNFLLQIAFDNDFTPSIFALGLILLVLDALFRLVSHEYFLTTAKTFGIILLTICMVISAVNISYHFRIDAGSYLLVGITAATFLFLRLIASAGFSRTDLVACSSLLLLCFSNNAGVAANIILFGLGITFIMAGSRNLKLLYLNYGMVMIIYVITIRFFDSSMGLLLRGIVFILLGTIFLGLNLSISKKRKEARAE